MSLQEVEEMKFLHTETSKKDLGEKAETHLFIVELKKSLDFQINTFYTQMTYAKFDQLLIDMMTNAMVWFKVMVLPPTKQSDIWVNPNSIRTITLSQGLGKDHAHR